MSSTVRVLHGKSYTIFCVLFCNPSKADKWRFGVPLHTEIRYRKYGCIFVLFIILIIFSRHSQRYRVPDALSFPTY